MQVKFLGALCGVIVLGLVNNAWASCTTYSSCSGCTDAGTAFMSDGCNNIKTTYYGVSESNRGALYEIKTCTACKSGYKLGAAQSVALSPSCTVTYQQCEADCSAGCSNCTSTSWAALRTGYESRTIATCSCTTCTKKTEYRCAAGYYGSSTNGTSGCTRCPTINGVTGTSAVGATAQTSCYIASGTSFSETVGKGTYTGNSYYCQ